MNERKTEHLIDRAGVARAAELLRAGEVVAFPTETVYGLGGDATNAKAIAGIYAAKERPSFNPLIVHVPSLAAAEALVSLPDWARKLAEAFWPGALTMVLPSRGVLPDIVSAGNPTLAVRVPSHPLALELLEAADRPLAAPSANPSGRVSATTAAHVLDGLSGRIAAVLDGGPTTVGLESTIIGGDAPSLLRPGGIAVERIEEVLGQAVATQAPKSQHAPTAPGQLTSHYAPRAAVRLNVELADPAEVHLGFGPIAGDMTLSATGDLTEAAARLFAALRELDAAGKPIAVAPIPEAGLGLAINDRLRRAAAPRS
ncbi:MAG: threonylcarbamoyl-AMP synthase [Rhodobacteraceae bacterium]|nr:threonylcarbamoyl-AMP synthase [Paracoccaceae bacterium]